MSESKRAPLHVRLSLLMHLPIQPEWRPVAHAELTRRFGDTPSDEDRDIEIAPFLHPTKPYLDSATAVGGSIPRRSFAERKGDHEFSIGTTPDGNSHRRGDPLTDPSAFLERLPERVWPLLPFLVFLLAVLLTAAVVAGSYYLS